MAGLHELSKSELQQQLNDISAGTFGSAQSHDDHDSHTYLTHELQVHQIELEIQNRELREAQLQLEVSRDRYAQLYDFAPIGYLTLNEAGIILEANLTVATLLGRRREHLLGFPLIHFVTADFRGPYMQYLRHCLREQRASAEMEITTRAGRIFAQLTSVADSDDENKKILRTTLTDIGERKEIEAALRLTNERLEERVRERTAELEQINQQLRSEIEAKEKLEQGLRQSARELTTMSQRKDEFLAMLCHELRNPLAPLCSGLSLLREPQSQQTVDQIHAMMQRQLGQLVQLVDDLLDVSRVQSGKIALKLEPIDLRAVLEHALESCFGSIAERGIELDVQLPDTAVAVQGDNVRLRQVIGNLLTNAAKFTDAGGKISVRLDIGDATHPGAGHGSGEARLRVIDTGCGIAPDLLPHIFDLFTQGETTLDRRHSGLGIGLTLVNNLVHMHGGNVLAFSRGKGHGAEFVVYLPLTSQPIATAAPPLPAQKRPAPPRRVLIVDDNEDSARALAVILQHWGHTVHCEFDGRAGVAAAAEFHPDVALLDIGLPGTDGYQTADLLRKQADADNLKLIALTGYGSDQHRQRGLRAGFDLHFIKPVDFNSLRAALE